MRISFFLPIFFAVACTSTPELTTTDTTSKTTDTTVIPPKKTPKDKETALTDLSNEILGHLKAKAYDKIITFVHPTLGLRLSPYGYVDTVSNRRFMGDQLPALAASKKVIKWGNFDGSGDPINLNADQYFDKFVYDVDFLKPEKKSLNKILGHGNSLINIDQVYPGTDYMEFYFSGFDKKYDGMDWRSLRLVYRNIAGTYYLVGIIHDQWTI